MMKMNFAKLSLLLTALAFVACAKKDIDKVSEGQDCLDKATATTALTCLEKIEGIDSASANIVRCAAYFVDQGFNDPTRISSVADQVTSGSGNQDSSSIQALSVMGFTSSKYSMANNYTLSQTAFAACTKSQAGGLVYLSSMNRIATALLNDLGYNPQSGTAPTPAELEQRLCTDGPSTDTKTAMGNAALAAYNQNCLNKDITQDVMCQQYKTAIDSSNSDPATIGETLRSQLCTP